MTEPWQESQEIVHRMQDQLNQARAEPAAASGSTEPPVGVAESMRGMVHVEVTAGQVSELRIDPRAMHQAADDLADAIKEATNAAFEDMKAAMTADLPAPPSMEAMSRTLQEISQDSFRAMNKAAEGMRQSMEAVQRISALHRKP